jgi:hypothetical protein
MSASSPAQAETGTATAIGFVAVVLWALLALLTASTGNVPPFQLVAMSFTVASVAGLAYWIVTGADIAERLRVPPAAWLLGTGGRFEFPRSPQRTADRSPLVPCSRPATCCPRGERGRAIGIEP